MKKIAGILFITLCILSGCSFTDTTSDKEKNENYEVLNKAIEAYDKNSEKTYAEVRYLMTMPIEDGGPLRFDYKEITGTIELQDKDGKTYIYSDFVEEGNHIYKYEKREDNTIYTLSAPEGVIDPSTYYEFDDVEGEGMEHNPIQLAKEQYLEGEYKPYFNYTIEEKDNGHVISIKCNDLKGYQEYIDEIMGVDSNNDVHYFNNHVVSKEEPLRIEIIFELDSAYNLKKYTQYYEYDYGDDLIYKANFMETLKEKEQFTYSIEDIDKIFEETRN